MLSPDILSALQILDHRSASVSAVGNTPSPENRFTRALAALEKLARTECIPIAIVDGLATIHYGYPAVTEDIDIAVGRADLSKLLRKAGEYNFRVVCQADSGWHTLEFANVEINVVPEGGRAEDEAPTTIPGPIEMGVHAGVDYADLPHWVELKLSSNRRKDQTHVIEVLKAHPPSLAKSIEEHLMSVHADYATRFRDLAVEAEQERRQEDNRRRR